MNSDCKIRLRDKDIMRERACSSGKVRDCLCVRVGAQLSAWKVMGEGGRGVSRGGEQVAKV